MSSQKNSLSYDPLGRKLLKGKHGILTLRPEYEFWTDEPLHVPNDCRVHYRHWVGAGKLKMPTNTTTRSLSNYLPAVSDVVKQSNPKIQLIEIGAGLGELVPAFSITLSRKFSSFTRPKVIDPLNYHYLLSMIEDMQGRNISEEEYGLLERVKDYACTIVDSRKVELINTTLGEAFQRHPGILGSADVVVDNWGAVAYTDTEFHPCDCVFNRTFKVKCMEERLLTPEGKLFTKGIDAQMLLYHRRSVRDKHLKIAGHSGR